MTDYKYGYDGMTRQRMLEKCREGWRSGGSETSCGQGSTIVHSRLVRSALPRIAKQYDVKTVADAGAGDCSWIRKVNWDVEYRPFDLFPRHPDVRELDITEEILPEVDLILCRHVLNHLSLKLAQDALDNFKASGSKYLLMTNCKNQQEYWAHYDFEYSEPLETWPDTTKWWLEIHEL